MKRLSALLAATALTASSLAIATPTTAGAAVTRNGCVTAAEFRVFHSGMTYAQTANLFDTNGGQVGRIEDGYYEGEWVEDGYWVYDGYFDGVSWVDLSYWEDTSYFDEYAGWVSYIDTWRVYNKCRSFDHGRGRVGVNFDNYSSRNSGMRSFSKQRYNTVTRTMFGRALDPSVSKDRPESVRPPKPAPQPTPKDPAKIAEAQQDARANN